MSSIKWWHKQNENINRYVKYKGESKRNFRAEKCNNWTVKKKKKKNWRGSKSDLTKQEKESENVRIDHLKISGQRNKNLKDWERLKKAWMTCIPNTWYGSLRRKVKEVKKFKLKNTIS